jgi:hypothetical protein
MLALVVVAGGASLIADNGFENWWDNNDSVAYQLVARRVGEVPHALIVSDAEWYVPLVMSRYLPSDAEFLLFRTPKIPALPPNRTAFVVVPTASMLEQLRKRDGDRGIENVSPNFSNAITEFHVSLRNSDASIRRGNPDSPDNALWLIEPTVQSALRRVPNGDRILERSQLRAPIAGHA